MKKIILLFALLATLLGCECPCPVQPTAFTNIEVKNVSFEDRVKVFVTVQAPNSVVGMFGIQAQDTIGSCSKGTFWAYKHRSYFSNVETELLGLVISFQGDNLPCQTAIPAGFLTGINIFEGSINTKFEVFDLSVEDGVNAILRVVVSDTVNWTTGDGDHQKTFIYSQNKFPLDSNLNIRGVFPYRCTDCIDLGTAIPENCFNLKDTCSTFRTCQVARTGNKGGTILLEYVSPVLIPAKE